MIKKLYIGNCQFEVDEEKLRQFVEEAGIQVSSVRIIRDRYTDKSRGFGFVELAGSEDVNKAIEALNGKELEGRPLRVNEAREQRPSEPRGSGGEGRGGRGDHRRDRKRDY